MEDREQYDTGERQVRVKLYVGDISALRTLATLRHAADCPASFPLRPAHPADREFVMRVNRAIDTLEAALQAVEPAGKDKHGEEAGA